MSDKGKELQLKYPGGRYHDIIVTNYLSIDHNNGELLIIFYNDKTLTNNDEDNNTFTLLRKDNDLYIHLYCGDEYDKVKEEIWPLLYDNKYTVKDINTLPNSIDYVIEYNYFKDETKTSDDEDVNEIIKRILNKVGVYSDPKLKQAYFAIQDDLKIKLELIHKINDNWKEIKKRIEDIINNSEFDMSRGYILFNDVSNFFHEIENVDTSTNEDSKENIIDNNLLKKSIYVIWNMNGELAFYEYNSYQIINDIYSYNYVNITNEYETFKKPLLNYILNYNLSINDNILIKEDGEELGSIALTKNGTNYEFSILPCTIKNRFNSLVLSSQIYIDSEEFRFPKEVFLKTLSGELDLVGEDETYTKEDIDEDNTPPVDDYLPIFKED